MTEKEKIDEIITMLDRFMEEGGGHMSVTVEDVDGMERMAKAFSVDCCTVQSACSVPTLHKGIDD